MIASKRQSYDLLQRGAFGNAFRTWSEVPADYDGLVGVRCAGRPGLPCITQLEPAEAARQGTLLQAQGHTVIFYETIDDSHVVLQGEVAELPGGLVLTYSTEKTTMRHALRSAKTATGLLARCLLRQHLSPSSVTDLEALLEQYNGHVVEFTAYDVFVGALLGRNAVVWEVRAY